MKKSILLAIVGLAASVAPSFGLGYIMMDNYFTDGPYVTYGPGSGGVVGTGLGAGWTAGLYYALGDVTGSIAADPTGNTDPAALGGGLTLGAGPGSTAAFYTSSADTPGAFQAFTGFDVNGNPGDTITVMIVAYNGSSYLTSFDRGHSTPFTMILAAQIQPPNTPSAVGTYMSGFSIIGPVPEPTTLALGSLGLATLMLFRRKKA
jgi:hypothetical protein